VKGQVSAEMIILLVALLALVAIVASNLINAGKQASSSIVEKVGNMTNTVGQMCIVDADCNGGRCVNGTCQ